MSGHSHFELYRDKRGEWRWRFRAANGKILAVSSEGYKEKGDANWGRQTLCIAVISSTADVEVIEP